MRPDGLRAQVDDGCKPRFRGGTACAAAANLRDRQFQATELDTARGSDVT